MPSPDSEISALDLALAVRRQGHKGTNPDTLAAIVIERAAVRLLRQTLESANGVYAEQAQALLEEGGYAAVAGMVKDARSSGDRAALSEVIDSLHQPVG
jgi:hypothetical protein